jgi:hypothetical protein
MLQLASIFVSFCVGYGLATEDSSLFTRLPGIIGYVCPSSDVCSINRSSETEDYIDFKEDKESCCAGSYKTVLWLICNRYIVL